MKSDPMELVVRYRRTVASRYGALKPEELAEIPSGQLWISPKIDGELWFAILDEGKASLVATAGRSLEGLPLIAELAAAAGRVKGRTILAGELFAAVAKGNRARVGDVSAALAEGGKALDRLGWQAFDAIEVDGATAPVGYEERLAAVHRILDGGKRATAVKTVATEDRAELESCWKEWGISGKAEGMIVRAHDGRVFKVKPVFTVDAVVVGYTPRAEAPDQLRSLLVALMRKDGSFQLLAGLGNLGGEAARRSLLAALVPIECPSRFRHTSGDGGLVRWVKPQIVVEVACSDVQAEDSDGAPIKRWALRYGADGWDPLGPSTCASLIHPALVRVRADKQVNEVDVRIAQLSERCLVSAIDEAASVVDLPKSSLTRRDVWTKEAKGKIAVRKLLVWKTNKAHAVQHWPAWVVHFTDYSPDRKTPLERTVKTAVSEAEAVQIADAIVAENIKKGWLPAGTPATGPSVDKAESPAETAPSAGKKAAKKAAKKDSDGDAEGPPREKSRTKKA